MTNKEIERDKKLFLELLNQAGFKSIKHFADSNEMGLGYSTITKWSVEKDKNGKLRPFPKWIFSWMRLYIENKKLVCLKNESELLRENTQLKEKISDISKIIGC